VQFRRDPEKLDVCAEWVLVSVGAEGPDRTAAACVRVCVRVMRACVCVCVCVCVMVSLTQCEVRAGLRARVSRGRTSHSDTCGHARCLSGKRLNSER
jgi:hypothetical protein